MNWVKQSFEIWEQQFPKEPVSRDAYKDEYLRLMYEHIERCGRVCYKSEDKIAPGTAEIFVNRLIRDCHYAMLEHGTVYLKVNFNSKKELFDSDILDRYDHNKYSIWQRTDIYDEGTIGKEHIKSHNLLITTNYRVIVENGWEDDLQYMCDTSPFHVKRYSVLLTTSRQIAMELLRHRHFSFGMESTRYCDYSKDRFGRELKFICPTWLEDNPNEPKLLEDPQFLESTKRFMDVLDLVEFTYDQLTRNYGWKPQQAATILPNCLKADLMMTGFAKDWSHLFGLRVKGTTGAPHPQMVELMKPVYDEFVKRKYIQQ